MKNLPRTIKRVLRKTIFRNNPYFGISPVITDGHFPAKSASLQKTLLVAVSPLFNQDIPNANLMVRLGMARGWAEVCGPARFVDARKLARALDTCDRPAVYVTDFDLQFLDTNTIRRLRDATDCFVWVSPHPDHVPALCKENPLLNPHDWDPMVTHLHKLAAICPTFLWTPYSRKKGEWFEGWRRRGYQVETIYDAADPVDHFPDPNPSRFANIKMAYVGGYWPEKAQGFEAYLRPWEDIFVPFGYAKWPYKHYGGQLTATEERQLYSSAGLIPLVTGPYHWTTGESLGRHFKAPACKAFCIADQNPVISELFTKDEMLRAENHEQFCEHVQDYMHGRIDTELWRERGFKAVVNKHLYRHRAQQILSLMN